MLIRIIHIACYSTHLQDIELVEKGFKKEDGPFVRALDQALDGFNVRRQAYYSGNHIHQTLRVNLTFNCTNNIELTLKQPLSIAQAHEGAV